MKWFKNKLFEIAWEENKSQYLISLEDVYEVIDQLDEPEVLSREWIDGHTYHEDEYDFYYVDPDELKNLLVPKQEITFEQAYDKLREVSILSQKSFDYYWNCISDDVEIDELKNTLVPKQEKVKIPKSWHDVIAQNKEECHSLRWVLNYIDNLPASNVDKFARAWLAYPDIEVEKEPKFIIDLDDEEISDGNHYLKHLEISEDGVNYRVCDSLNAMTFESEEEAKLIAEYVGGKVEELEE